MRGNSLLKPCYLNKEEHDRKIRTRKKVTDFGKYSFENRAPKIWEYLQFHCLLSSVRLTLLENGLRI